MEWAEHKFKAGAVGSFAALVATAAWVAALAGGGCNRTEPDPRSLPGSTRACRAQARLVFSSTAPLDGSWQGKPAPAAGIWVVNADGSRARPLIRGEVPGQDSQNPVFSPDGTRIAFDSRRALGGPGKSPPAGSSNIWVMNADGGGLVPLTRNNRPGLDSLAPAFSANGERIVFDSKGALDGSADGVATGSYNVWIMKADGTAKAALTRNTGTGLDSLTPVLSVDGLEVVFQSFTARDESWDGKPSPSREIWVMNVNGTQRRPLTHGLGADINSFGPALSADGKKVAYGSTAPLEVSAGARSAPRKPAGSLNIWAAWADGTLRAPLTRNELPARDSYGPSFSPDGGRILFYSKLALDGSWDGAAAASRNIWVMSQDGGNRVPLTRNSAAQLDSWRPSFSPDAALVAFHSKMALDRIVNGKGTDSFNLWVMNADGSEKTALTRATAPGMDSYQFRGWFQPEKCFPAAPAPNP